MLRLHSLERIHIPPVWCARVCVCVRAQFGMVLSCVPIPVIAKAVLPPPGSVTLSILLLPLFPLRPSLSPAVYAPVRSPRLPFCNLQNVVLRNRRPFEVYIVYIFVKVCNLYRLALLFRSLEGDPNSCADNGAIPPFLGRAPWSAGTRLVPPLAC